MKYLLPFLLCLSGCTFQLGGQLGKPQQDTFTKAEIAQAFQELRAMIEKDK